MAWGGSDTHRAAEPGHQPHDAWVLLHALNRRENLHEQLGGATERLGAYDLADVVMGNMEGAAKHVATNMSKTFVKQFRA